MATNPDISNLAAINELLKVCVRQLKNGKDFLPAQQPTGRCCFQHVPPRRDFCRRGVLRDQAIMTAEVSGIKGMSRQKSVENWRFLGCLTPFGFSASR